MGGVWEANKATETVFSMFQVFEMAFITSLLSCIFPYRRRTFREKTEAPALIASTDAWL